MEPVELQDAPPCKRPLLVHPPNVQGPDCDKYSFRVPNLGSPQHISLPPPFELLPNHGSPTSRLIEEKNFPGLPDFLSRCKNADLNEKDDATPSSSPQRSEAFKKINQVSNKS